MDDRRRPKTLLRRYAPFLLVLAAQALLVAVLPSTGTATQGLAALDQLQPDFDSGFDAGFAGGDLSPDGGTVSTDGSGDTDLTGDSSTGGDNGITGTGGGTGGTGGRTSGQRGDTSHCTKDGRQQGVTAFSSACVPKWSGDNGGATYKGVTATTINAVMVRNTFGEIVDGALAAGGLAATPEEEESTMKDFSKFFNKHYETYGREVKWSYYLTSCDASTSVECARTEARKIVQKFNPFIVVTSLTVLPAYHHELSKAGVVNIGGWHQSASFNQKLRPFHWDWMPDGSRIAKSVADYWCKKMTGRTAALAGDPLIRPQERYLAVVGADSPETQEVIGELFTHITNGCGSKSKAPRNYKYSAGFDKAGEEMSAMANDMSNNGVTTVVCMCDPIRPIFMTSAMTNAGFFPEHLISGMGAIDHDYFGRLYDQSQWRNAFGVGIQPAAVPLEEQDDYRAYEDVGAQYRCYACLANFIWMHMAHIQMQYAGANLNPLTLERGTLSSPAIGGFENTGNSLVPLVEFGPGQYTALADAFEVWWNPSASSEIDGRPGSYECVQPDCRRFRIGNWPGGDPKTPRK